MDKNIRRALYTALVAGGLMVAGASAAHAAEEGLPEPVTQGTTDTIEGSAAARGDLDTTAEVRKPEAGADGGAGLPTGAGAGRAAEDLTGAVEDAADAADADGVVGDVVGPKGILGSLAAGDVGGVVDGALGEGGLVDALLGGLPPSEVPGPDGPGTEEPGAGEPGADPGTDGPGTDEPGTDEPGTDEPGTDEPGTDEPGTDEPGTDEPGTDEPGVEDPGAEDPGTDKPGTSKPGTDGAEPGAGTNGAGTDRPAADRPGTGSESAGPERPARVVLTDAFPGDSSHDYGVDTRYLAATAIDGPEDADAPAAERDAERGLPGGGVDISWGDKAEAVPEGEYDGRILSGDRGIGLLGTMPEPEADPEDQAEVKPAAAPGDTGPLVRTGHMFTGQLSLISLLMGLGIAVLRMRRR
ncbi:hypothetical protein ACFT2C_01380 [Promicromonospora sp. NPDC057138]|uniref:hypothetical protein n=1 Tax=Promicromonospora sp. NPDC057138 TaxID=3346031 RepID=UPI00362D664A